MNDRDVIERIHSAGNTGDATATIDTGAVRREATRRARRRRRNGAALLAGAVAVPAAIVGLNVLLTDSPNKAPGKADKDAPGVTSLAPGCPPDLPTLMSSADVGAKALSSPLAARAGQELTLPAKVSAEQADRALTSVKFIVVRDRSATNSLETLLKESNQLASVEIDEPTAGLLSTRLQVPTDTPAGEYTIVAYGTWPGPALCGVPNDPKNTRIGTSYGKVGTLIVSK